MSHAAFAQTAQKGKVVLQNSGREALSGVQITAYGAQPADTDNEGIFKLNFTKSGPGDMIPLKNAYKKGYELVNRSELDKWILSEEKEMAVVMCPAGSLIQAREKYYDIGNSAYMKRYEQALEEIESQKESQRLNEQEYDDRLEIAYNELSSALDRLRDYSEVFAKINKDDLSELEGRAFQLLEAGNLDGAILLYENEKLMDKLQQQIKIKETASSEIGEMIASLKRYADICVFAGGENNLNKAAQIYESLALANPDDYQSQLDYGIFLRHTVKYDEAIVWMQKALKCADNKISIAQTQTETGELYYLNRNYDQSVGFTEKSLAIYQDEAEKNPQYNVNVAENLCNVCNSYLLREKYDESVSLLNTATEYLEKSDRADSSLYLEVDANITSILAYILKSKSMNTFNADTSDMHYYFEESIRKCHRLMQADSAKYASTYLDALHNIAIYYGENTVLREKCILKEIDICRELYRRNPFQGAIKLGDAYNSLSVLYTKMREYDKAKKYTLNAYELRKELARENPNAFLQKVYTSLSNLGDIAMLQYNYNEGINYILESIKLSERLYQKDESTNCQYLIMSYCQIIEFLTSIKDPGSLRSIKDQYFWSDDSLDAYYSKAEQIIRLHPEIDNSAANVFILKQLSDYYEHRDRQKYSVYSNKLDSFVVENPYDNIMDTILYFYENAVEAYSKNDFSKADFFYKRTYATLETAFSQVEQNDSVIISQQYICWAAINYFCERKNVDDATNFLDLFKKLNSTNFTEAVWLFYTDALAKFRKLYKLINDANKLQSIEKEIDELMNYFAEIIVDEKIEQIDWNAYGQYWEKENWKNIAELFYDKIK
jgi:hypothetical protein